MDPVIHAAYNAALAGKMYAFATVIETSSKGTPRKAGAKMIVFPDGSIVGSIGGGKDEKLAIAECLSAIRCQKPKMISYELTGRNGQPVCGGKFHIFVEPFPPPKHLIICGAGHIALPLSVMAKMLNFNITVIDTRKDFANTGRFPHADAVWAGPFARRLKSVAIDAHTSIVILTHGHEFDWECLKAVIQSSARYVGVISSQSKRRHFLAALKKEGLLPARRSLLHMPTGIDIGAQTPEEIAVSIMAEIIKEHNKDFLNSAKFSTK